jgi:hypothetical protein
MPWFLTGTRQRSKKQMAARMANPAATGRKRMFP